MPPLAEHDDLLPGEYAAGVPRRYGRTVTRPAAEQHRWSRALPLLILAAVLITVVASLIVANGDTAKGVAYGVLGLASVIVVLLLRHRAPGPTVAVAGALSMSAAILDPIPPFALLPFAGAVVVALVSGAAVWALVTVALAYAAAISAVFLTADPVPAARGVGGLFVLLLALGTGAFLRTRAARREEEARSALQRQRTAIEEERLRIARELHDVLAHSLSSITVQAGVGLHLAADRPEAATEALETIRAASREALDEVRGVLGILRGDDTAPLTPGPDVDAVAALVEETRRSGARVTLDDRMQPRPPVPLQLAVYRVVQEALTNARRHAPGAAVEIVLARAPRVVTASVRDRRPDGAPPEPVAGNGITGMRERASALGGTLALVVHDDGLEVALRLPAEEDPA